MSVEALGSAQGHVATSVQSWYEFVHCTRRVAARLHPACTAQLTPLQPMGGTPLLMHLRLPLPLGAASPLHQMLLTTVRLTCHQLVLYCLYCMH